MKITLDGTPEELKKILGIDNLDLLQQNYTGLVIESCPVPQYARQFTPPPQYTQPMYSSPYLQQDQNYQANLNRIMQQQQSMFSCNTPMAFGNEYAGTCNPYRQQDTNRYGHNTSTCHKPNINIKGISVFNNTYTEFISTTTLSNGNVLIAYENSGNSDYGTYIILDSSCNIVKEPTVFNSAGTQYISTSALANGNVFIVYRDEGNNGYGTYIILDINGNIVKEPTVFNSADTQYISTSALSNGNIFIVYCDIGKGHGTYIILDNDGNIVKEPTVFNKTYTEFISTTTLANGNVFIAYQNAGNSCYGYYTILDINGNVVKSATVFNMASTYFISCAVLSNGNILIAYRDDGASYYGYYTILDINGNVVKSATVFNKASTNYISTTVLSNDDVIISYRNDASVNFRTCRNDGNNTYGAYVILDSNGNVVKKPTIFNSVATKFISSVVLTNGDVMLICGGSTGIVYLISTHTHIKVAGKVAK